MKRTPSRAISWRTIPVPETSGSRRVKHPIDLSYRILGVDDHGIGVVTGRIVFHGWIAVELDGQPQVRVRKRVKEAAAMSTQISCCADSPSGTNSRVFG